MISRQNLLFLSLILTLLVGQANCLTPAQNRVVKIGETFTLKPDESAATEDAKLKIRLKGVGREIYEHGEIEYAELEVQFNKTKRLIIIREKAEATKIVGDFVIELINAESFGKTHCQLKISPKT